MLGDSLGLALGNLLSPALAVLLGDVLGGELGFKLELELGNELGDSDGSSLVILQVGRSDTLGSKLSEGVLLGLAEGFIEGDSLGFACR